MLFPAASWMKARALWVWEPTLSRGLVVGSSPWLVYAGLSSQFPLQNPLPHTLAPCDVASRPLIPLEKWLPGTQPPFPFTVEFSEAKPLSSSATLLKSGSPPRLPILSHSSLCLTLTRLSQVPHDHSEKRPQNTRHSPAVPTPSWVSEVPIHQPLCLLTVEGCACPFCFLLRSRGNDP